MGILPYLYLILCICQAIVSSCVCRFWFWTIIISNRISILGTLWHLVPNCLCNTVFSRVIVVMVSDHNFLFIGLLMWYLLLLLLHNRRLKKQILNIIYLTFSYLQFMLTCITWKCGCSCFWMILYETTYIVLMCFFLFCFYPCTWTYYMCLFNIFWYYIKYKWSFYLQTETHQDTKYN